MTEIIIGSDYSGVGAFDEAIKRNCKNFGATYKTAFACDLDKFARKTFIENNGTESDKILVNSKEHDTICTQIFKYTEGKLDNFSKQDEVDLFTKAEGLARKFSFYYPMNVYGRKIPDKPIDWYMTSPPCQGFSIAGNSITVSPLELLIANTCLFND